MAVLAISIILYGVNLYLYTGNKTKISDESYWNESKPSSVTIHMKATKQYGNCLFLSRDYPL